MGLLTDNEMAGGAGFGTAVAVTEGFMAASDPSDNGDTGLVKGFTWNYTQSSVDLQVRSGLSSSGDASGDRWGEDIVIDGTRLAALGVGGDRLLRIFDYADGGTLVAESSTPGMGGYSNSLAFSSDSLFIADLDYVAEGGSQGSLSVFSKDQGQVSWVLQNNVIVSKNALPNDGYGESVAVSNEHVLVGAPGFHANGEAVSGIVYVYQK